MTTFCLAIVVVNHAPSYSHYSCVFRLLRGTSAPPRGWSVRLGGGCHMVRVLGRCFRRVAQRWLIACGYLLLPVVDLLRADGLWLRLVLPLQSPDFSWVRGSPFAIRPFISVQIRADGRYRLGTTIGCDGGAERSLCVAHVAYRPFLPHLRPGLYLPFAECLISR